MSSIIDLLDEVTVARQKYDALNKLYSETYNTTWVRTYQMFCEGNIGKTFMIKPNHYIKIIEQHKYDKTKFRCEYLSMSESLPDARTGTTNGSISYGFADYTIQEYSRVYGNIKGWKEMDIDLGAVFKHLKKNFEICKEFEAK